MALEIFNFKKAIPVWKKDDGCVMNQTVEFSTDIIGNGETLLYITGCSSYLVFINGRFIAHGPARTAKGFYKVDCIPIENYLTDGENSLKIRASGYNMNSFSYIDQPSFICAEIVRGDTVLAATGDNGFSAVLYKNRVQKVPRYSYQRTFSEVYRTGVNDCPAVEIAPAGEKKFISRDVPYCDYDIIYPQKAYQKGSVGYSEKERYYESRFLSGTFGAYKMFTLDEVEYAPNIEYEKIDFITEEKGDFDTACIDIPADSYVDVVFERNSAGLISFEVECDSNATLFVSFDEILTDGTPDPFRLETLSVLTVETKGGTHKIITAEPYVMKYARLTAKGGAVKVRHFALVEIAYPMSKIKCEYKTDDPKLQRIYDSALHTFRTNAADIYMDCASRERAGWLCDSFYIGRSERLFTGGGSVERAFLQNFLFPEKFDGLPDGMLPMCYPSDVMNGEFIPNWAMWYALHLYEYCEHSGDRELALAARGRMYALLSYFKGFENEYGLLEKLDGWIFVEWSKANELVQDVSFPSNMIYAAFKSVLGVLYDDTALIEEARKLRKTIVDMSMTPSGFFCDNAVRVDGKLTLSGERTEVCQYYAFFTKCVTPETHPELWERMLNDFGRVREESHKYPEIYPANAFIGNYIRIELLLNYGYTEKLAEDIKAFFIEMSDKTGSLWEHMSATASCSHGFAAYVACVLKELEK